MEDSNQTKKKPDHPESEESRIQNEAPENKREDEATEMTPPETEKDKVAVLEKKLNETAEEAKTFQERFLRASADLENYRKRVAREMADFRKYAHESFAKDILPVMDNLERALDSADGEDPKVKPLADGVEMIRKELSKVLEKHGVTLVEAQGKPFDPCFHQAVSQQASDEHPDNTVVSEFQKGYLISGRLLRPAMVVVSTGGAQKQDDSEKSENADECKT